MTWTPYIRKALYALTLIFATAPSVANEQASLTVGVREVPPFAFQTDSGEWAGISVELWQRIAENQGWEFQWLALDDVQAMVTQLSRGEVDVAVGALSMTSERETIIDYSHSFFSTSLALATPQQGSNWQAFLESLLAPAFLKAVGALFLLLLAVGAVIFLLERRRNPEQFGGNVVQGLGNGLWWSAVTMTTVGYGDKSPVTGAGRLIATVWMFVSVITISGFTAAIASSVTLGQSQGRIEGLADLERSRNLAVPASTGAKVLLDRQIGFSPVDNPIEGLERLTTGQADAFVYDRAILQFLTKDLETPPSLIAIAGFTQNYAFGLRPGFPGTEAMNRQLLAELGSSEWNAIQHRYLGTE